MNNWTAFTINELMYVQNGYAFKSGDYIEERADTLEVLKMGHIEKGGGLRRNPKKDFVPKTEYLKRWILEKNDIVLAMTDMKDNVVILGVPALIDRSDRYVLNQRVARLTVKDHQRIDVRFIYCYLKWEDFLFELQNKASSGVQVNLSTAAIKESIVKVPSFSEQVEIADLLIGLDKKIDLLHRQNKTLEAMAETLFRQWFVEDVQDGWDERSLSSIANFLNGLACQKHPPTNDLEKLPVLKIRELSSGISDSSDWATSQVKPDYIVEAGDVIFAWSASLMVKVWDGPKCVLNQHLFKVTSDEFPKWFYLRWCKHHLAEFIAVAASHATTMGHIKRGDLDAAKVLVPPPATLKTMSKQMQPLLDKQIAIAKQRKTLEKLRDTLLPKLMSGEVRVAY
jgi:type I restriction enzyme, S subunit